MVSHPKTPILSLFVPLIVVVPFNCFWIQLLGQVIFCVWPYTYAPHS